MGGNLEVVNDKWCDLRVLKFVLDLTLWLLVELILIQEVIKLLLYPLQSKTDYPKCRDLRFVFGREIFG